jgi:hypothetical protein
MVKKAREGKEDLSSFVERKDLRISGAGVGFPLWTFYLDVMKAIDTAAVEAQNRFLFELRNCLVTSVQHWKLEEVFRASLRSAAPKKGSTVLKTSSIQDGVPLIKGLTKGGYLIFSSVEGDLVDAIIRALSTEPRRD